MSGVDMVGEELFAPHVVAFLGIVGRGSVRDQAQGPGVLGKCPTTEPS